MWRLFLSKLGLAASRFSNMQTVGHGLVLLVKVGEPQANGVFIRYRTDLAHDRLALVARNKMYEILDLRILLLKVGHHVQRTVEHILAGSNVFVTRLPAIKLQDLGGLFLLQLA